MSTIVIEQTTVEISNLNDHLQGGLYQYHYPSPFPRTAFPNKFIRFIHVIIVLVHIVTLGNAPYSPLSLLLGFTVGGQVPYGYQALKSLARPEKRGFTP